MSEIALEIDVFAYFQSLKISFPNVVYEINSKLYNGSKKYSRLRQPIAWISFAQKQAWLQNISLNRKSERESNKRLNLMKFLPLVIFLSLLWL